MLATRWRLLRSFVELMSATLRLIPYICIFVLSKIYKKGSRFRKMHLLFSQLVVTSWQVRNRGGDYFWLKKLRLPNTSFVPLSNTVGQARASEAGKLSSIPDRVIPMTWKMVLAAYPASCLAARESRTGRASIRACYQCSLHCESRLSGACCNWRWAPLTTHDTPKDVRSKCDGIFFNVGSQLRMSENYIHQYFVLCR